MAHIHSSLVTAVVIIAKCALWPRLPISHKCLLAVCSLAVGRECHEWLCDQQSWIHSLAFSLSSALVSYQLSLFDALSHKIYPRARQISACQRVDVSVGGKKRARETEERGGERKGWRVSAAAVTLRFAYTVTLHSLCALRTYLRSRLLRVLIALFIFCHHPNLCCLVIR